ncbi:beta-hydroxyacyl-ACP dehydratase [Paraburkholderia phosphatilytica]|uniref:ApeP family dehydratase n=1 Tax=Paraburkholderia phosphatilytica TaxID=2282883 RepID=UPI000E54E39B|nr:beta-hydroxyacyl-ACP dehydratase [Paraburkholderia phosphatilytica]
MNDRSQPDATFPPIEEIIPHRDTMLLLDAVTAFTGESIAATARVHAHAWYADADGAMPAWIGVELMAQAIAAHVGLLAIRAGGHALPGVLLGSQRYRAALPAFAAGARLQISAKELLRTDEGTAAYECAITCMKGEGEVERELWAEAIIKAFQPRDFQSFIEGSFRS